MTKRRRWTAISAAAIRRKLIDTISCGASLCKNRPSSEKPKPLRNLRSDRLLDLLKFEISDSNSSSSDEVASEAETRRKVEALEEMKTAVRELQCGGERRAAAMKVRRMAKDDGDARETMSVLGAIPLLIAMIDDQGGDVSRIEALYALLNLGIGNDVNKSAIVKAGAVNKMLDLIRSNPAPSISEAIVANFLSLTALDSNKPIIGSSHSIQFLAKSFKSPTSSQTQQESLRALFNLSISSSNIPLLISAAVVPLLMSSLSDMESSSDRILSILSNIVATSEGRKAVTASTDAIPTLIDVLYWIDSPTCQEKAAYIIMVIAHKSEIHRNLLTEHGIKSALLELVLVGSNLSQKRAARILEILRVEKGKQVSEGFFLGLAAVSAPVGEAGVSEERRAVRELVNESLECNLKRIVKRANLMKEFGPSDWLNGGFTFNATSKSLPF